MVLDLLKGLWLETVEDPWSKDPAELPERAHGHFGYKLGSSFLALRFAIKGE
jgi:hypothetical protein